MTYKLLVKRREINELNNLFVAIVLEDERSATSFHFPPKGAPGKSVCR